MSHADPLAPPNPKLPQYETDEDLRERLCRETPWPVNHRKGQLLLGPFNSFLELLEAIERTYPENDNARR